MLFIKFDCHAAYRLSASAGILFGCNRQYLLFIHFSDTSDPLGYPRWEQPASTESPSESVTTTAEAIPFPFTTGNVRYTRINIFASLF